MPEKFEISSNKFLIKKTTGYYNRFYLGFKKPNNPDFLNTLKNTFNTENSQSLKSAKKSVYDILIKDIPQIIKANNLSNCVIMCLPRAKTTDSYHDTQQMFKNAVSAAASNIQGAIDGTQYIERIVDTFTTHLPESIGRAAVTGKKTKNNGKKPYPGITRDTCQISDKLIKNKNIILIDDIYTVTVNIDEDCIQALYDMGANNVIFYAIGYTNIKK